MDERAVIRSFEKGRGWWVVAAIVAMLLVALLIAAVVNGFHGRSVSRGTDALTRPMPPATPGARTLPSPGAGSR